MRCYTFSVHKSIYVSQLNTKPRDGYGRAKNLEQNNIPALLLWLCNMEQVRIALVVDITMVTIWQLP